MGYVYIRDTSPVHDSASGSDDQLTPLDVDGIKEITLIFNNEVQLGADAATLSGAVGLNVELFGPLTKPGPDAGTFQATWLLDSPLSPDEYTLMLFDTVVDLNGVQLDGEWIDGVSTVSGDGIPGGDFVFRFNIGPAGSPGGPAVPESSGIVLAD